MREEYELEYESNVLEVHVDAVGSDDRVVILDDLLATGGTVAATANLCKRLGADVLGAMFLIELEGLNGAKYWYRHPFTTFIPSLTETEARKPYGHPHWVDICHALMDWETAWYAMFHARR